MALQYELTGDVLHVTETQHGFHNTEIRHWYYNIKLWLVSNYGQLGDTSERPMVKDAIDWVKKYHLPKVALQGVKGEE